MSQHDWLVEKAWLGEAFAYALNQWDAAVLLQ
jgi:hypothetical protein